MVTARQLTCSEFGYWVYEEQQTQGHLMYRCAARICAIFLSIGLGAQGAQAEPIPDATQLVVRLNPKRDPGRPPYTVTDCFAVDSCLSALTQKLLQAGGNPGLIAGSKKERLPDVLGEESIYRFEPPAGESFCKVLLLKMSMAPSSGKSAPELKFSASKKTVLATVRLPAGEGAPPRAWFDGLLILLSVKEDVKFAERSCSLKEKAQETTCKGNCQNLEF
jgi:hypothetical protein